MSTNIFAYTVPEGPSPAYLSLNEEDGGQIFLTVRSAQHEGKPQEQATIALSSEQLEALCEAVYRHLYDE